MARASRSSKKQPDFDPSEIEDLIFSPAVGKGVGSHLVTPVHLGTIATSPVTSQVTLDVTTVGAPFTPETEPTVEPQVNIDRLAKPDMATVVTPSVDVSTVATNPSATVVTPQSAQLWITEHGDLVSAARVKRIRLAQDVINSAEESVYDTLWNGRLVASDDLSRLVQAGYDYLVKRTRLSRKTIQRIVAKLLEKDFIEVDTRADIYQRTATVYRVFSYKAVLERNTKKGRLHVAKMGPGFSYARPVQTSDIPGEGNINMATVDTSIVTPVVNKAMATVAKPPTVTVVKNDRPTVVKMSPYLLDAKSLDSTSSEHAAVRSALSDYGNPDDDVVSQLLAACRSYASDCTEDEVVHFIREKGHLLQRRDNRVQNPLGFLLTAVPKCFSGQPLSEYRGREAARAGAPGPSTATVPEDPALLRWRKEQERALSDPSVSEQEKHLIRLCLGLNTPHL